jgi:small-conductance mechanosensitive channel
MSKLLAILYDVADIRTGCQQVHDERFGLSLRRVLGALRGGARANSAAQCARLQRLRERLEEARRSLDALDDEDLSVRRGLEIRDTLREYATALARSLTGLEQLCRHERALPVAPAGDDTAAIKVLYDDAIQHQKRLAVRLNALISSL